MVNFLSRPGIFLMGSKWRLTVFGGIAAMIASMTAQKVMTDKVFWKLVRREIEEEEEIVHQLSQQHVKQTLERKKTA
jgi:siderophore synthetase component